MQSERPLAYECCQQQNLLKFQMQRIRACWDSFERTVIDHTWHCADSGGSERNTSEQWNELIRPMF
jgi:hypothetical protein